MKTNIAFDIETEGFNALSGDRVTVAGFADGDDAPVLFFNTDGRDVDVEELKDHLKEISGEDVVLIPCEDEEELFNGLTAFVDDMDTSEERLVAYNGLTWKGGFDIPFLRTRHIKTGVDWMFEGIPYADLLPPITDDLNTSVEGELDIVFNKLNKGPVKEFGRSIGMDIPNSSNKGEDIEKIKENGYDDDALRAYALEHEIDFSVTINDLDGVHDHLFGEDECGYDPYDDSEEAVAAFNNGDFETLLQHNLADIIRTRNIVEVVEGCIWKDTPSRHKNNIDEQFL